MTEALTQSRDKHTQGPWKAIKEDDQEWSIWYEYHLDGEESPRSSWLADSINSEADARLIAAAPELLEALILLVAGIENSVSDTYVPLVKARAAIAKAEEP